MTLDGMLVALLGGALITTYVTADLPVNCSYSEVQGNWIFYETERTHNSSIDCREMGPIVHKKYLSLMFPNIAVDEHGNKGTWTMIYNEGFEVRVAGRSYFAFSYYQQNGKEVISMCDRTFNGWSRDVTIRNWACYRAQKQDTVDPKFNTPTRTLQEPDRNYAYNTDYIKEINAIQNSWRAEVYPEFEKLTYDDIFRMSGGQLTTDNRAHPGQPDTLTRIRSLFLPKTWDWRNVSGVNYVSPIRNQGTCGSCYAFASMAALESRIRIMTKNEHQPILSPQDIVGCSKYSQGCEGGFPFLIAGRYAQDFGAVLEECAPYEGKDDICKTERSCARHYTARYNYVGGYYGACNEESMKLALVRGGPLAVGFEVYSDFMHYKKGVYHHTGLMDKFNPFEVTNHAVLLVGYGSDETSEEPYWTVKNSWGEKWGEEGFFRIRRRNDECGIESMALEVVPIP